MPTNAFINGVQRVIRTGISACRVHCKLGLHCQYYNIIYRTDIYLILYFSQVPVRERLEMWLAPMHRYEKKLNIELHSMGTCSKLFWLDVMPFEFQQNIYIAEN